MLAAFSALWIAASMDARREVTVTSQAKLGVETLTARVFESKLSCKSQQVAAADLPSRGNFDVWEMKRNINGIVAAAFPELLFSAKSQKRQGHMDDLVHPVLNKLLFKSLYHKCPASVRP